ncbi:MAG TPA: hypothetical protein VK820_04670 [Steroidobacteraceae bacterium]|jgi:hypothetical protein|nr:hypothetical protein [Steroidobacteraceae bacterium]
MDRIITSFVGLDVHKDSIAVAIAPTGREPPRFVGTVMPQWAPLSKALGRLGRARELQIVYEAGPWRAQLRLAQRYRHLSARKLALNKICVAIARELSAFVWDIARQVKPSV